MQCTERANCPCVLCSSAPATCFRLRQVRTRVSAHVPRPDSAPYTASKHGVTGLTKSISLDGRKYDIACSQIDIGNALTELSARIATGVKQANGERIPEAMIDVQHIADAIVHMASLPIDVNVQFITIMATKMPFIGRG